MFLKFKNLRVELLQWLESLCDLETNLSDRYTDEPGSKYFGITDLIGFLYDDLGLRKPAEKLIGMFLYNEEEYAILQELLDSIDRAIPNMHTFRDRDEIHILKTKEFGKVQEIACLALAILNKLKE